MSRLELTDSAKEYLLKVGKPNVSLSVKGGGCSGFQYEWGVTDKEPTVGNLWLDPMAEMFFSNFPKRFDIIEDTLLGKDRFRYIEFWVLDMATSSCCSGALSVPF